MLKYIIKLGRSTRKINITDRATMIQLMANLLKKKNTIEPEKVEKQLQKTKMNKKNIQKKCLS